MKHGPPFIAGKNPAFFGPKNSNMTAFFKFIINLTFLWCPYPSPTDRNRPDKPQLARSNTEEGRTGLGNNTGSGGGTALATGNVGSSNAVLGAAGPGTQV